MTGAHHPDRDGLVAQICERLAIGEPLAVICRTLGLSRRVVYQWRDADPDVMERMQDARDDGEDAIAWNIRQLVRPKDGIKDSLTSVQRDKLMSETDLKLLAKFNPKRWGDRLVTENTTHATVEIVDTDEMDRRLDRAIAAASAPDGNGEPVTG